jgi:hypothetical protein
MKLIVFGAHGGVGKAVVSFTRFLETQNTRANPSIDHEQLG